MTCAALSTAAGTVVAVSATAAASPWDKAAYVAVGTYTAIGNISSISEIGRKYAPATFKALGSRTTCKRKGSYDFGSLNIGLGYVAEDAGVILLKAALLVDTSYSFKITLNDATATLVVPTVFYFMGQVMSFVVNPGSDPDSFVTATCEVQIDGDVLTVARAAS